MQGAYKFSANDFEKWSNHYEKEYGWITVPRTCKSALCMGKLSVKDNLISYKESNLRDLHVNGPNWKQRSLDLASQYESNLTGIGLLLGKDIVVIDFDDEHFYRHWYAVYRIKSKLVKTNRGYHLYLKTKQPFHKVVSTAYYGIIGCTPLPPSVYYAKKDKGVYHKWPKGFYSWYENRELAEVDIFDIGLVSRRLENSEITNICCEPLLSKEQMLL